MMEVARYTHIYNSFYHCSAVRILSPVYRLHFIPGLQFSFFPRFEDFILPPVYSLLSADCVLYWLTGIVRNLQFLTWVGSRQRQEKKKKTEKKVCWSEEVVVVWDIPTSKRDKSICPGTKFVLYRLEFINGVKCMHVTVVCTRLYLDF